MIGNIIFYLLGLATPYVAPWAWAKWTSVGWPALRAKLPAWLGGS